MRSLPPSLLRRCVVLLFLTYVSAVADDTPKAAEPKEATAATTFVRLQHGMNDEPLAMQTATVRYVPADGDGELTVDLIGVVHIGDKAYYEKLNKQFEQYDVLLYELVAPPDMRVPPKGGGNSDNPLAMIQKMMFTVLDLDSQMELIDYDKENFVHADLSPEEMMKAIRERGDDGFTLTLSVAADFLRQQNLATLKQAENSEGEPAEVEEVDPFALLFDANGSVKLKRMMAASMAAQMDTSTGLGKTLETILIDDRNKAAMKVFQKELAKGKKRIGIFYGAAHMPDFEKRLLTDFGLKRDKTTWLTAWNLKPQASESSFERLLKLLDE